MVIAVSLDTRRPDSQVVGIALREGIERFQPPLALSDCVSADCEHRVNPHAHALAMIGRLNAVVDLLVIDAQRVRFLGEQVDRGGYTHHETVSGQLRRPVR
ncbi:hypothetical protein D3C75_1124180 [compost metagenome]